jgi:hypothetical protein
MLTFWSDEQEVFGDGEMVVRKDKRRERFLRAIIAHQISTFTSSVKPDEDFLRLILFIFVDSCFPFSNYAALAFPKLRVWGDLYF